MDRLQSLWQQTQRQVKSSAEQLKHRATDAAERVKETVEEKAKQSAEKVHETVHDTKARAKLKAHEVSSSIVDNVKSNKAFLAETAREKADALRHRAGETLTDASHEVRDRAHFFKQQSETKAAVLADQATQSLRSHVADGAQKLRDSSAAVVDRLDPRIHARRTRNRLLVLGFSAIALYGFASAAPDALSKYAIERVKIQEEAKLKQRERDHDKQQVDR